MKSTFVSREGNDVKFTMEFTADEIEQEKVKVYQANKNQFTVDGFRKGKAPRSIIEKKYGDVFIEDAVNNLLMDAYPAALKELDVEVIDAPRTEFSPIEAGKDLTVTVTVAVYPEYVIKDYKGVEIEEEVAEVTEQDLDAELRMMQYRSARMESVDAPAEEGNIVIMDFVGKVDGVEFEGGSAENYSLSLGSNTFIPGFEEQLIGVKAGETKDVVVTFPEDYMEESLAGKEAVFTCTVHEVKVEELPELDDEFAKDVSEFDTLEELKEDAKAKILVEKEKTALSMMQDRIVRKIAEANDIEIPESMIMDELNEIEKNMDNQLRQQGLSLTQYLAMGGKTPEDFREEIRPNAVRRVENRIIVRSVAEQEDFQPTDEEVNEQMQMMADQFGMEVEQVKNLLGEENEEFLKQDIRMQKAIDFLYENAVKVPKKEEAEEAEKED